MKKQTFITCTCSNCKTTFESNDPDIHIVVNMGESCLCPDCSVDVIMQNKDKFYNITGIKL